jgi:Glycosyl hydrolase family 12
MTPLAKISPFIRTPALLAALTAGGLLAVSLPAANSDAAATTTRLCKSQTLPVGGGAYAVENNEWGSSAAECITTDRGTDFTVANSSIANAANGAPGGYPAIYKGCHWGACTRGSGFPLQVSGIRAGKVTTSWSTSQPGGSSDYDVAYDIWFNQTPAASGQPNGTELMIWLNHNGPVQPFGSQAARNVAIGGRGYNVWFGKQGWNTVSYTMTSGSSSVRNLDLQPLIADAVRRGYISPSWYLIDVEAGFELWQGGAGLATNSFSVKVAGGGAPLPRPNPASPTSPATSPVPSSSPASPASPASPPSSPTPAPSPTATPSPHISLQAISPNPPTSGTSTNVTVDFKNTSSTMASNLTLVTRILNKAGTVVGSQSQTGQNVAPQQTLNLSYAWTAPSPAGTYTIEGLVQDSSGKTLEHAKVGTVTVKREVRG